MNRLDWISLCNLTVLCTHQIDAAYWHEWELFRLPGGNQLNLMLNLPLIGSALFALCVIVTRSPRAGLAHAYLIGLGLLTVVLHGGFYATGHSQFMQPMSYLLMVAIGVLSIGQCLALRSDNPAKPLA